MGGLQAYHMAVMYPDFVERVVVLTGAARVGVPGGPVGELVRDRANVSSYGPVEGDSAGVLASIKASVLLMPSRTDLYFPPEDSAEEVKHLKHGELKTIVTVWGHVCGGGGESKEDTEFIKQSIKQLLGT